MVVIVSLQVWRTRPLIFVDDLEHPVLSDADFHHYRRVRRLRDGADVTISDGRGGWRLAEFGETPQALGPATFEPAPEHPSIIGFAPVKGERPEWVVQKLTELGVDVILPLQTKRSVVRWDADRAAKQVVKWRNIAREASMQSRRVRIPSVLALAGLADLADLADVGHVGEVGPVLAEPGARNLDGKADRFVLIGPEGGWDDQEREGRELRALPGGVLRAETAAIAAAVLLASSR